jgi:large subunit ribosomal protein L35
MVKKYKMKTHSGAKKRFKKLKSGLIKATRPFRRKLLIKKSEKRKRHLRSALYINPSDMGRIGRLFPYPA